MPKMKTNSGAAKRFKQRAGGGFKHKAANRNHILTKKAPKRKAQLRPMRGVHFNDQTMIARLLRLK